MKRGSREGAIRASAAAALLVFLSFPAAAGPTTGAAAPAQPKAGSAAPRAATVALDGVKAARATPRVKPAASHYPSLIGEMTSYVARHEDTLIDLARRFNVGYTELVAANPGVDPWLPGKGTVVVLPTAHIVPPATGEGLVVNLAEQRLYYFMPDGRTVVTAPIGVGSEGWATPKGSTTVVRKRERPTWYVPKSIREQDPDLPAIVPPGPDNPLGEYALYLGWRSYIIHGTNKPAGVGRRVSHGCVRMYPEDIAWLFSEVKIGTPVTVLDQPLKVAWVGEKLMIEVHPSQDQADEIEAGKEISPEMPQEYEYRVLQAAGAFAGRLDWDAIHRAVRDRTGVPVSILKGKDIPAESAG